MYSWTSSAIIALIASAVGEIGLALGALQDHEVDLVDLRGRARQPDAALRRADILGRPDGDLQVALA
jgi:hypothetical protein